MLILGAEANKEASVSSDLYRVCNGKALQFHLLTAPFFRTGQETS